MDSSSVTSGTNATALQYNDLREDVLTGWISLAVTLTYSSADSPVFVANTSIDLTSYVSVGDRVRLTQTTTKYFIVVAISSTTITLYGGTDYSLVNAAISSVAFSGQSRPIGFPYDADKWSVKVTDTADTSINNPVTNTWYNINTFKIDIPIGKWFVSYECVAQTVDASGQWGSNQATLSTANNTESDAEFSSMGEYSQGAAGAINNTATLRRQKPLSLSSKTSYYLNHRVRNNTSIDTLTLKGTNGTAVITARSQYF